MKHEEYILQKALCRYLEVEYPDVFFLSDTIANLQLNALQAGRNKAIQKNDFSCPDLLILEPKNGYSGLFLELKLETPFKKDGSIKKQMVKKYQWVGKKKILVSEYNHLEKQAKSIEALNKKGYNASFSVGFDESKEKIDNYLKQ